DTKFDRRVTRRKRAYLNGVRDRVCTKYRRRLDDFCHKAAAMLAGFARRNRVAQVEYDDSDQEYLPGFCWFKLRTLCAEKLSAVGIRLVLAEGCPAPAPE